MSCDLENSRGVQCKNKLGGLNKIYIFPYTKYAKSKITVEKLVLLDFPNTDVKEFEIVSGNYSGNSAVNDGGDYVEQSLTVIMTYLNEDNEWQKLVKKDHCVIFLDNNNKYRLMGVYNGCETEYQSTTGDTKADFNGWTLNFKAKEQDQPLYFDSLDDVGFNIK